MSQRTRLKKMSLGAALILGTVSVSNFAEATENGSSTIPGIKSEANKVSVNEAGSQISDASTSDASPVSTGPSERVGGNASGNSARIGWANNLYRYYSGLTFKNLFEAAKGLLGIDLNSGLSAKTLASKINFKQWRDFASKIARGDYTPKVADIFLSGMKRFNPQYAEKIELERNEAKVTKNAEQKKEDALRKIDKEYSAKRAEIQKSYQKFLKTLSPKDAVKKGKDAIRKIDEEYSAKRAEIEKSYQQSLENVADQEELIQKAATEEADVANVANQKDLSGQAGTDAADVANVENQEDLSGQAGTEAANVAEEITESEPPENRSDNSSTKKDVADQEELIQKAATEEADVAEAADVADQEDLSGQAATEAKKG